MTDHHTRFEIKSLSRQVSHGEFAGAIPRPFKKNYAHVRQFAVARISGRFCFLSLQCLLRGNGKENLVQKGDGLDQLH